MSRTLVLTGFMGTGKTCSGKVIARRLGRYFFDTDDLVEERVGYKIDEIFKRYGEAYFRRIESEVIGEVMSKESIVVACGGGATLNLLNVNMLKSKGIIVNLYASAEEIYKRLRGDRGRPLLNCKDSSREIEEFLDIRRDAYKDCDFAFNTEGLTVCEVADNILNNIDIRRLLEL